MSQPAPAPAQAPNPNQLRPAPVNGVEDDGPSGARFASPLAKGSGAAQPQPTNAVEDSPFLPVTDLPADSPFLSTSTPPPTATPANPEAALMAAVSGLKPATADTFKEGTPLQADAIRPNPHNPGPPTKSFMDAWAPTPLGTAPWAPGVKITGLTAETPAEYAGKRATMESDRMGQKSQLEGVRAQGMASPMSPAPGYQPSAATVAVPSAPVATPGQAPGFRAQYDDKRKQMENERLKNKSLLDGARGQGMASPMSPAPNYPAPAMQAPAPMGQPLSQPMGGLMDDGPSGSKFASPLTKTRQMSKMLGQPRSSSQGRDDFFNSF